MKALPPIIALVLAGCIHDRNVLEPTPYTERGPRDGMFGYEDVTYNGRIHINVVVNLATTRGTLLAYFDRRAKDLCADDGFRSYSGSPYVGTMTGQAPDQTRFSSGSYQGFTRGSATTYRGGDDVVIGSYASGDVQCRDHR